MSHEEKPGLTWSDLYHFLHSDPEARCNLVGLAWLAVADPLHKGAQALLLTAAYGPAQVCSVLDVAGVPLHEEIYKAREDAGKPLPGPVLASNRGG